MFWNGILRARGSDKGTRPSICDIFQPPVHDHHSRSRSHRFGRASPPWKVIIIIKTQIKRDF